MKGFVGFGRNALKDIVRPYTHVCGILAGNGFASAGKYKGIAPECLLVCGKVLDYKGGGSLRSLLKGLQWIINIRKELPIRILNISIEMEADANFNPDEWKQMHHYLEMLWQDDVMIIAAAGNRGPEPMSISPISENGCCVCVSCNDGDFVGAGGRTCAKYSGRGPGKGDIQPSRMDNPLKKPDIVAPGTDIISCSNKLHPFYISKSGTSMATPLVSGACALFMQKYPNATNIQVKRCLIYSARDLGETWDIQGAGMLSVRGLLQCGRKM